MTAPAAKAGKEDKEFKYPIATDFHLPELPECTGLNGNRKLGDKTDCRQIGRYSSLPGGKWFAQIEESKGAEVNVNTKKFEYPVARDFFLPELPECTGLNGNRKLGDKTDCRQIGRYSSLPAGKWFAQLEESKEEAKDGAPNYDKLTSGTPQLPECTGLNGDRWT